LGGEDAGDEERSAEKCPAVQSHVVES